jgi:hypothetical protein
VQDPDLIDLLELRAAEPLKAVKGGLETIKGAWLTPRGVPEDLERSSGLPNARRLHLVEPLPRADIRELNDPEALIEHLTYEPMKVIGDFLLHLSTHRVCGSCRYGLR